MPEDRFNTTQAMREAVFFDGPESKSRYSRFWLLLVLAAVIASAGVVADSTATVIGAMIVAPLMTGSARVELARTSEPPCFSVMPMPQVTPALSVRGANDGS